MEQTDVQTDYRNPRSACAPRVNQYLTSGRSGIENKDADIRKWYISFRHADAGTFTNQQAHYRGITA